MKPEFFKGLKLYKRDAFAHDVVAGIIVAIIALPLSIALGIQSEASLQQGLLTAISAGFLIALFGGTRFQIGGPSATFVAVVASYMLNPEIGMVGVQLATIGAGIVLIIMGLLKIGGLVKYIPYPIVIGFTTSIGITLIVSQVKDFFALTFPPDTAGDFISKIIACFQSFGTLQIATLGIGIITLAILVYFPKITKKIPPAAIAIIVATLVTSALSKTLFDATIPTIGSTFGEVKAEIYLLPVNKLADFNFTQIIVPSIVLAFLSAMESLLSATVADEMTNLRHDSNMELVAEGIANIGSGCIGGLPATGAIARTAANIKNGARTPMAGMIHAVIVLLMYIVLMPVVQFIPMTSLAAVLIIVSIGMANFKLFGNLMTFNWKDTTVIFVTCTLTLLKDLVWGVGGGIGVALLLQIPALLKPITLIEEDDNSDFFGVATFLKEEVMIYKATGNINFTNAANFQSLCAEILKQTDLLVIDMSDVKSVDITGVEKMVKAERRALLNGKSIMFLNENPSVAFQHKKAQRVISGS
jgi:SulP family sulfate permease